MIKENYLMKCDCCEDVYSELDFPLISSHYENLLQECIKETYIRLSLCGRIALIENGEFICGLRYSYHDKTEEDKSEEICQALTNTWKETYLCQLDYDEVRYKYLN